MSIAFAQVVPVLCKQMSQGCCYAAFTKQPSLSPGEGKSPSEAALGTPRTREKSAAAFRSKVSKEQSIAMKFLLKFYLLTPVILISLGLAACSGVKGGTG